MTEKLIILTKKSSLHSTHLYRTLLQVQTIIEFYRKNLKVKKAEKQEQLLLNYSRLFN